MMRSSRVGALGIKVQVGGRLGGAEIARSYTDREGSIPLHTLRADVDYGMTESRTAFGNVGIKVWIYRGDILPEARQAPPTPTTETAAPQAARPGWRRAPMPSMAADEAEARAARATKDIETGELPPAGVPMMPMAESPAREPERDQSGSDQKE
jgi:ribosomal protein S3